MLSVQGLTRTVAGRALVDDVGFEMRRGEVLAVLGPSGGGKTSLLRLIAGFDAPSAGSISLQGVCVSQSGRVLLPPERRALGMAFQEATLFAHLDAVDNVVFALHQGSPAQRREAARSALAEMGLPAMDQRRVATLSGGEAQRVALARALVNPGRLLLLDEPFGNVDRPTRADLLQRLRQRIAASMGAIIVTHDPADALELDARVLLMRQGRLVADAPQDRVRAGDAGEWARRFLAAGEAAPQA